MTVLSAPEMRFGTKQDVPFIIAVIRDGMRMGILTLMMMTDCLSSKVRSQKPLPGGNGERIAPISCLSLMLNIMAQR